MTMFLFLAALIVFGTAYVTVLTLLVATEAHMKRLDLASKGELPCD